MNRNRKHRLNLSLVRKSESPKSAAQPVLLLNNEANLAAAECNTPVASRKRSSTFSDGSPVMNDYDNSPILMSQDTSNMVTGVSWAWNSPKRTIPDECRPRPRPLLVSNNINPPTREPKLHKQATERLVGFYKFQVELKKIQTESQDNGSKEAQNKPTDVSPPLPSSPDHTDLFDSFSESEINVVEPPAADDQRTTVDPPPYKEVIQMDSFNDSAFDSLLLQASQAAEKKSQNKGDAVTSHEVAGSEKTPNKRRSFFKSRTINDLDSIAMNDLLNDSVDFCLIEASQIVESAVELKNPEQKTMEPVGSKKANTALTRHRSMPASPSQRVPVQNNSDASTVLLRAKFDANFPKSGTSSSAASHVSSDSAPLQQPVRLCTKEEIEQKRQEALKRQQARRLNRLGALANNGPNNHPLANVKRS